MKMVALLSILAMLFSLFLSLVLPVIIVVYLYKRWDISLRAVLIGVLTFFISQIVLRIPLLNYLANLSWFQNFSGNIIIYSLFLALTAGLFEETGRYLGFRYLLSDQLKWKNGIAFGLGHGGIEAIIFVGLTNINNLIYSFMINSGKFNSVIGNKLPEATAALVKKQLITTSAAIFAAGGIERVFAITIQIAFSLIVLYAVVKRKKIFVIYAILLHFIIDTPAAIVQFTDLSIWIAEFILLIMSIAAVWFIIRSRDMIT